MKARALVLCLLAAGAARAQYPGDGGAWGAASVTGIVSPAAVVTTMSGSAVTCAAGAGTSTLTLDLSCPNTGGHVIAPIINSDADGCTVTVSETSAQLGCVADISLSSSAGGTVTLAAVSNVFVPTTTWTPAVGDTMRAVYTDLANDAWLETGRGQVCALAGCTMTGQVTFSGVTTDVTTGTNEDLTLAPNGTGKTQVGRLVATWAPGANNGTDIDTSIALTTPADSSGTNVHTGILITPVIGNATAGTNTVHDIAIAATTGDAQVTHDAINIGAITGTAGDEAAIVLGAGWDRGISTSLNTDLVLDPLGTGDIHLSAGSDHQIYLDDDNQAAAGLIETNTNIMTIESNGSTGFLRIGGNTVVGMSDNKTATQEVMRIADSISRTSAGTFLWGMGGSGLTWHNTQTCTCSAGAVTCDIQSDMVDIVTGGATCVVTISETTGHATGLDIGPVIITIDAPGGGHNVTFPNVANVFKGPLLCTTTGLTIQGASMTVKYDGVQDFWFATGCVDQL